MESISREMFGCIGVTEENPMTSIEAVFQNDVFKPTRPVSLPENQRVRLSVEPVATLDAQSWLEEVRQTQQRIRNERGLFADSTPDIAEDRAR
jgi:predicted DNA-binding antitoxin AbrB/MazE fold protein